MKLYLVAALLGAWFLFGCGNSSESDLALAAKGVNALSGLALANNRRLHDVALTVYQAQQKKWRACVVGTKTSGVYTIKTECPGNNVTKLTITSTSEQKGTCAGTTVILGNVSATFTLTTVGGTITFAGDMGGDLNSKRLACAYSSSINVTAGTSSVSDLGYLCKYDGTDLPREMLKENACTLT